MKKFLKFLVIFIFVIIVLGGIGLLIFVKNFDINTHKDQIIKSVSQQLGRQLTIENATLDLSFKRGTILILSNVALADDPTYSKGDFVSVQKIYVRVDLKPLLTQRIISVEKIELEQPRINVFLSDQGSNYGSLIKQKTSPSQNDTSVSTHSSSEKSQNFDVSNLKIGEIRISDGILQYAQGKGAEAFAVTVKRIDLLITDFSFNDKFSSRLQASLWSNKQNIQAEWITQLFLKSGEVRITEFPFEFDLASIDSKQMQADLGLKSQSLPIESVRGALSARIDELSVNDKGVQNLKINAGLSNGVLQTIYLDQPFSDMKASIEGTAKFLELKQAQAKIGTGRIDIQGKILNWMNDPQMNLSIDLQDLPLDQENFKKRIGMDLKGKVVGSVRIEGGLSDLNAVMNNLKGEVALAVEDARIVDLNVLDFAVENLVGTILPGIFGTIGQAVYQSGGKNALLKNVPERVRQKMQLRDTEITEAVFNGNISDGKIFITKLVGAAQEFRFQSTGYVDWQQNAKLNSRLNLSSELSNDLMTAEPALESLANDQRQIEIKFKPYAGPVDQYRPTPEFTASQKDVLKSRAQEEIRKQLRKVLPQSESPPLKEGEQPPTQNEPKEKRIEEILLENVFENLPIFE